MDHDTLVIRSRYKLSRVSRECNGSNRHGMSYIKKIVSNTAAINFDPDWEKKRWQKKTAITLEGGTKLSGGNVKQEDRGRVGGGFCSTSDVFSVGTLSCVFSNVSRTNKASCEYSHLHSSHCQTILSPPPPVFLFFLTYATHMENFPRPSKVCTFSPVSTLYWLTSPEDDPVAMCFESGENFAVQACTRI